MTLFIYNAFCSWQSTTSAARSRRLVLPVPQKSRYTQKACKFRCKWESWGDTSSACYLVFTIVIATRWCIPCRVSNTYMCIKLPICTKISQDKYTFLRIYLTVANSNIADYYAPVPAGSLGNEGTPQYLKWLVDPRDTVDRLLTRTSVYYTTVKRNSTARHVCLPGST